MTRIKIGILQTHIHTAGQKEDGAVSMIARGVEVWEDDINTSV